jgi:L-iditol 2-dehydrogenase
MRSNKMKQAYMPEPGIIKYRDVKKPIIKPDRVIIKIVKIGICGSDYHVFKGKHPLVSFPLVQGHEFSGYIENIGKNVQGLNIGDLVTVLPAIGCGVCSKCKKGLIAQCNNLNFIGGNLPGAGSKYLMVNAKQVIKIPEGVTPGDAAMVEPLAVAVHAVKKIDLQDKNIFIVGAGTIGNLVAQVARVYNAKNIFISDILPSRIKLAKELGFNSINPINIPSISKYIQKQVDSVSIAFECVGKEIPLNNCIDLVERGGYIVVLGVYEDMAKTNMLMVQDKEINIMGSLMYTREDFKEAIKLLADKKVNVEKLQTDHFSFKEWLKGYQLLEKNPDKTIKVIIDVSE